jgi:alkylation response protein AidB-like acyl-CoA dehydrogenase
MAKDAVGYTLTALNRLAGSGLVDRMGMRRLMERMAYSLTKSGFRAITTTARAFQSSGKLGKPERLKAPGVTKELFDLNITDEQQMIRDSVQGFSDKVLRPRGEDADARQTTSDETRASARELGLNFFAVPESLGGAGTERSPVTTMLVAEDLAHGDMGQAVAILAPMSVANALTRWGNADQQSRYLPAFAEDEPPAATMAVAEPRVLFDPQQLHTTARKSGSQWVLNGDKSLVPLAGEAELFLVAAQAPDGPQVFIVEGGSDGLTTSENPPMGVRAAGMRPLHLDNVQVPEANRLSAEDFDYREFVDLGTLAWCSLAVGTGQAVLDYVIPYVNEREAFGEPISHRQSVAFMVANIAMELDSMRILTWRAVSRAESGLPFHRETHLARTLVKDKAMQIGTDGVQLLGGHGYTQEYPVERWYRDMRAIGVMFGGLHL